MAKHRSRYTSSELDEAVRQVIEHGRSMTSVSNETKISLRTLQKYVAIVRRRIHEIPPTIQSNSFVSSNKPPTRRGPKPVMTLELEEDLVGWIVGMQQKGCPVSQSEIIAKANDIYQCLGRNGAMPTRASNKLGAGWFQRFIGRHPHLSSRTAQPIAKARNSASREIIRQFCNVLLRIFIENNVTPQQIFNMDETAFATKGVSRKVVALKGSRNVWTKTVNTSFHVTFVACISATGFALPPLIIVPGKRLNRDVMNASTVEGACITTAPKGWINADIFNKWLIMFAKTVPKTVARPLVLLLDGCSSHIPITESSEIAKEIGVIMVLLPPNATHLLQPLDVGVFKSFKTDLRAYTQELLVKEGLTVLTKKNVVQIGDKAWKSAIMSKPENIISSFRSCGIYPLSLPIMYSRLSLFDSGGIASKVVRTLPDNSCLKAREVRSSILTLPPLQETKKRRRTVDVEGRLLTKKQIIST